MWSGWLGAGTPEQQRAHYAGLRYWVGMGATVFSLGLLVRFVDLSRAAAALRSIDLALAALTLATVILTILLKAIRWKILFQPRASQPGTTRAIIILVVGQMINTVFPLRFGEIGRIYLAAEVEGIPPARSAATIIVEKIIDTIMLVVCLALVLPFVPLPEWLRQPALATFALAASLAVLAVTLARWRGGARAMLARALGALPFRLASCLARQVDVTLQSLGAVGHLGVAVQIALLSAAIWGLAVLTNYAAFLALKMAAPFVAAVFLLIVLQVGVAVPSAPGRLGVFQALTLLGLSIFSVDTSVALTYSLFLHLVVFLPPAVAGVALLWRLNASIYKRKAHEARPQASTGGERP